MESSWSTGLCGCFDDVPNCCITWLCPWITFGRIAEIVDEGRTPCTVSGAIYAIIFHLIPGCVSCYSRRYRTRLREQYLLSGSACGDCCVHYFCETCALCQEYRELQNRGFDMSKGWKGHLARQNTGITMAPGVEGGMTK